MALAVGGTSAVEWKCELHLG